MLDKFYIKTMIRDDGERLEFDGREVYLSENNTMLVRPEIFSTDVSYTDVDGGEMIRQKLPPHEQVFNGLIFPRTTDYWDLYFMLVAFFKINHYYKLIYTKKNGEFFAQQKAWMSRNLQVSPLANEDHSDFSVGFRIQNSSLYEYAEDAEGNEILANSATLPLIFASQGGEDWDSVGTVWDSVGEVWETGAGGVQDVFVNSVAPIYPVWTVLGPSVNPRLQNNTTDTLAVYDGTVAAGQKLVVDFAEGVARLDSAVVTRNITGQVSFRPGINVAGFSSDGGETSTSKIAWNNIIG